MSIQKKKEKILAELSTITSQDDRYKYIIQKGRDLPVIPETKKEEKFLIQGCMSQAWLIPEFKDGRIVFQADSDAAIVKGIMAVILGVYSGNTPDEILSLDAGFLKDAGITEHLSMNRRNGLASVVKQIKLYATVLKSMQSF